MNEVDLAKKIISEYASHNDQERLTIEVIESLATNLVKTAAMTKEIVKRLNQATSLEQRITQLQNYTKLFSTVNKTLDQYTSLNTKLARLILERDNGQK